MDTLTWTSHRTLMRPFHGLGVDLETVGLTKYVLEAIALAYPHRPIDPKLTLSGVKGAQDVLDDQSPSLSLAFLWIILDRTLDYYSVALGLLDSSQLTMQVVFTP